MFNKLSTLISSAGFANEKRVLLLGILFPAIFSGLVFEWLKVSGLSLAIFAGSLAFEFEFLSIRAARRQRQILECWPIVIESLESAAVAGMSLVESLRDIAESEQLLVAQEFAECCSGLDAGLGFDQSLFALKSRLSNPAADFTIELLRIANSLGSSGYVSALRNQAISLRSDASLAAELAAKQGWVVGTAKLAVTAPWLIVLILSFRPENAQLYASILGTTLLIIGLFASALALRMVYRIGSLTRMQRVFA